MRITWARAEDKSQITFQVTVSRIAWGSIGFSENFEMIGAQAVAGRFDVLVSIALYDLQGKDVSAVNLDTGCTSCLAGIGAEQNLDEGFTSFEFTYHASSNNIPYLNTVLGFDGAG